ncbi:hypothetical protein INR49_019923 [Caranx melampygus]|nr:hypothetical protein INR49_019923 [Caranx melampygus]
MGRSRVRVIQDGTPGAPGEQERLKSSLTCLSRSGQHTTSTAVIARVLAVLRHGDVVVGQNSSIQGIHSLPGVRSGMRCLPMVLH